MNPRGQSAAAKHPMDGQAAVKTNGAPWQPPRGALNGQPDTRGGTAPSELRFLRHRADVHHANDSSKRQQGNRCRSNRDDGERLCELRDLPPTRSCPATHGDRFAARGGCDKGPERLPKGNEAANPPQVPDSPLKRDSSAEACSGSRLCTQCGLCCMGIIHQVAVLDPAEDSRAVASGLHILPTERPLFALPCSRLEGTICGIYEHRPKACARYKCQLLQDVEAGRTQIDEAAGKIVEAKRLLAEVRAAMPSDMDYHQVRRLAQGAEPSSADGDGGALPRSRLMQLKLRAMALELFVDRFFRNSRDRKSFEMTALEFDSEENQ